MSQMAFVTRGMPCDARATRSTASESNGKLPLPPPWRQRWRIYWATSAGSSGTMSSRTETRWRNCRRSSRRIRSRSSFWPASTTCNSLRSAVSKFISSRTSSSNSAESLWASSTSSTAVLPSWSQVIRNSQNRSRRCAWLRPSTGNPKPIRISSRNSAGGTLVLKTEQNRTLSSGTDWISFRSSVVLPVPTSPVNTAVPRRPSTVKIKPASASRWVGARYRNSGSGVIEKGALDRWKNSSYISRILGRRRFARRNGRDDSGYPPDDGDIRRQFPFTQQHIAFDLAGQPTQQSQQQAQRAAYTYPRGAIRSRGLHGRLGRIDHREPFTLLAALQVGGHVGSQAVVEQRLVIGLGDFIIARQGGQFLLAHRQGVHAALQRGDLGQNLLSFVVAELQFAIGQRQLRAQA